jgi:aspartate aminotransferase-like enzyme
MSSRVMHITSSPDPSFARALQSPIPARRQAPSANGPNSGRMAELLLIPGPVTVSADVLAAAAQPMRNHRGPSAAAVYAHLIERLQDIFQTKQPVLLLGSSGTGAMEASVVNLFSPGDKLVAMPMGAFGDRHVALARAYGADVEILGCEWGSAPDPQRLRDRLAADRAGVIKGVLVTHNETSTGVQADLEALARARADHPALLVVDAVSSVGATNVKMDDWGLDAVITASQKAIAGVPGAAMIALSKRAWEATERAAMPRFYFDARKAQAALAKGQTPWTPPFGVLLALEQATDNYMKEGRHSAFARHARFAAAIRAGCSALGLSLFARPGVYSNTVTAFSATAATDHRALQQSLRERYGVVVGGGQMQLEGKVLRIGNMGAIGRKDIITALAALEMALRDSGLAPSSGAGVAAANAVFAESEAAAPRVAVG